MTLGELLTDSDHLRKDLPEKTLRDSVIVMIILVTALLPCLDGFLLSLLELGRQRLCHSLDALRNEGGARIEGEELAKTDDVALEVIGNLEKLAGT